MEAKINIMAGKLLRVNRSIRAKGIFALTKQDLYYRRFLRGVHRRFRQNGRSWPSRPAFSSPIINS